MRIIVGLGNPGKDYVGTRHNIGFELIDTLATAHRIKVDQKRDRALVGPGTIAGQAVLLVKPQTFMNDSGVSVAALLRRENVPLSNLLVIVDDTHLSVGKLRFRAQGSSGGHNGLKSIASHLATQEWARLRIGVGEAPPGTQIEWVLGRYSRGERKIMDEALIEAIGAVEVWLQEGIATAMNRYNGDGATTPASPLRALTSMPSESHPQPEPRSSSSM
jgi:PTH1 family peptidyl-tRNA hydrolase